MRMKITEPIEASSGIRATCKSCGKGFTVGSLSVASQITNHGCQGCRDKEFEGGENTMGKPIQKRGPAEKATVKEIIKNNPKLVKGNGKTDEHPAVKDAKSKKIAVQPKFDEVKDPEQIVDAQIESWAIERKKISKAKVALMAKETELGDLIRGRLTELGLKHYKNGDLVEIELETVKDKLKITINDDEED